MNTEGYMLIRQRRYVLFVRYSAVKIIFIYRMLIKHTKLQKFIFRYPGF